LSAQKNKSPMSIYDTPLILTYCIILSFILGISMGSFINCAAYRVSHGKSFLKGRSICPSCGHELGFFDLFPLFSWIFLGGKCRYCKAKISVRYPLTELFFGLLTVGCLLRFDLTFTCARNFLFLCCLFFLALVDFESFIIPDGALIISAAVWLVWVPFSGDPLGTLWKGLLCGVAFGAIMLVLSLILDKILMRDTLGGGDIKLFAVIGLYVGPFGSLFTLILACIVGLIFAGLRRVLVKNAPEQIPFGPSIAFAAAVMLFVGEIFVNWYLGLLGI